MSRDSNPPIHDMGRAVRKSSVIMYSFLFKICATRLNFEPLQLPSSCDCQSMISYLRLDSLIGRKHGRPFFESVLYHAVDACQTIQESGQHQADRCTLSNFTSIYIRTRDGVFIFSSLSNLSNCRGHGFNGSQDQASTVLSAVCIWVLNRLTKHNAYIYATVGLIDTWPDVFLHPSIEFWY
jgi:hypothetical protein